MSAKKMGDVFALPLDCRFGVPIIHTADGQQICSLMSTMGQVEPEMKRAGAIMLAVNCHDALLQTVKDLVGLAAMRPGKLGDYKAALADARALIERAEGRA